MRIELYFELEKNIIPSDNRAMFVSFLKKTLEECNQGKYYEHYFTGTDRKDYCFVPLFDKPQYEKDKIILASPRLKLIFSASDKSKIGQIFYFAFIGMKHKRFPLPDQNSMIETLSLIVKGNMDNAEPVFAVGGLSERKTHYFENVVHVKEDRLELSEDLIIKKNQGFHAALLKGQTLENEKEIEETLKTMNMPEFFQTLKEEVREYYGV